MAILAIDQATKSGYAVVDDDGKIRESGTWLTADKRRTGESRGMRYVRFRKMMEETLDRNPDIALIVHEQTLLRGGSATELANGFKGHILELASEYDIPVTCVHATELKKWATGSGKADKEDMMTFAELRLGRPVIDDNEADAVLIGLWAFNAYSVKGKPGIKA